MVNKLSTSVYLPALCELQLGVILDHGLDLLGQSIPSLQEVIKIIIKIDGDRGG